MKNAVDDEEEDCICIEQPIEQITIDDDDTPSCSRLVTVVANATTTNSTDAATVSASKRVVRIIEQRDKPYESPVALRTPVAKVQTTCVSAPVSPSYAAVVAAEAEKSHTQKLLTSTPSEKSRNPQAADAPINPQGFFVDVTSVAWFDSINSSDTFTNYTLGCSTLRDETTKKRRSVRVKRRNQSDTDVIVLDDTITDATVVPAEAPSTFSSSPSSSASRSGKRKSANLDDDDSVVFVSESNPNELPTYIPLDDDNVPNPVKEVPNPYLPKRHKPINPLFTLSERKQLDKYNDNAYNPHADEEKEQSPKRMVIVDGSNVAYSHALNKEFSVNGLKICLQYFEKMGHEVKAVVPQHRLQRHKSTDPEELERMHRAGKIVFTPCKNLPGMSSSSYDDRFVLQLACELDAAIVSNDNYRDLLNENKAFKKVIENRVIGYSWCNDMFMVPKDPYGKWGPTLHTILNRV